jgi:DNA invertase Pin-like site-specific DNA recombinase
MIFGYTNKLKDHSLQFQKQTLKSRACESIISENKDGKRFSSLLESLEKGDTLIIISLKVVNLPLTKLIKTLGELNKKGINFISVNENLSELEIFSQLLDFSTHARKQSSEKGRERGKSGGRKKGLSEASHKKALSVLMHHKNKTSIEDIMINLGIGSTSTIYRYVEYAEEYHKQEAKKAKEKRSKKEK